MIPAPGPAARPEAPSSECPRCNGEGRLQTSWGIANVPEDAEFSPCPDCDGTGKTSREDRAKQGELPERIFLQIRDDEGNLLDASEGDDVTWCVDQINDTDEEYVRVESRAATRAGEAQEVELRVDDRTLTILQHADGKSEYLATYWTEDRQLRLQEGSLTDYISTLRWLLTGELKAKAEQPAQEQADAAAVERAAIAVVECLSLENMQRPSFTFGRIEALAAVLAAARGGK